MSPHSASPAAESIATSEDGVSAEQKLLADLRDANEQLLLAALRAQDLTDQAESAKTLAELATERLRENEHELRATAEFRERLLGIVGHDLRTPLSAISTCAQLLVSESYTDAESLRSLAGFLLRSVHRMDRMIKQLFQFTRARFPCGTPLELAKTDLRLLCQHAIEELSLTSKTPIAAVYKGDTTGTWDGERLIEVLSNLLGNAIDHATPDTDVRLQVLGAGNEVAVEVINHGAPIPEDLHPVLFQAFHRGRSPQPGKGGHLGLGLYIASEIVRCHCGTLLAWSANGLTTFEMRLPRVPPSTVSAPRGI